MLGYIQVTIKVYSFGTPFTCMHAYIIYICIYIIWQDRFEIQIQIQIQTQTHATLSVCTVQIVKP
jgi:hypothetical protein